MRAAGFFTRVTAKESRSAKKVGRRQGVHIQDLRALGVAGVASMNPRALTPNMMPRGNWPADIYVLGHAPSDVDDAGGKPFTGSVGMLIREELCTVPTVYDNICRTLPPDGRQPQVNEIECFRREVEASIEEAKPRVVIGLGLGPLRWALEPDLNSIKALRGKRFPVKIGKHVCWFMPTLHPEFLMRVADKREDKVPGKEWMRFWRQDLRNAMKLAASDEQPVLVSREEALKGVQHCMTSTDVEKAVKHLMKCDAIGVDGEMHHFRPYQKGALLLSLAFSDGETTYAIPFDHPSSPWAPNGPNALQRPVLIDLLRKLLTGPRWVAHNAQHEYEWMLAYLGDGVHEAKWGCSQQAAFALDPGPPSRDGDDGGGAAGHRLEDLTLREFGLPIKSLTPGAEWVARLRELPLPQVLDYNAIDAKWCLPTWRRLVKRCKQEGVYESYKRQISRLAPIVHAQAVGIPISQPIRQEMEKDLRGQISKVLDEVRTDPDVLEFERRQHRPFNIGSTADIGKLLRYQLNIKEVMVGGKISTKKSILEGLRGRVPMIGSLLQYRSLDKLLGTYVLRFDPNHPQSYVHADGLVHSKFPISKTRTARLACEDPNSQNWPKRKNKQIRRQLIAPPGWHWVAVDQGQIEARVLAMESCDPEWMRMIRENYDVHAEWAAKVAKIDDGFRRLWDENPKEARSIAKNQWVFPAFYGSSLNSIITNLKLNNQTKANRLFKEFWDVFAGVKRWQQRQSKKYERDGYVTSLTGRRRLGPLSYNMVINSPIQTTASDICVDGMERTFWLGREKGMPWLAARLQIHDDLSFLIPDEHLEFGVAAIVREQLNFQAPWVNVPLSIEAEMGKDLSAMEKIGSWTTTDLA